MPQKFQRPKTFRRETISEDKLKTPNFFLRQIVQFD